MADVVFYVGGHQDDVLLFRGNVLYNDFQWKPPVKVVNIVTTAGDGGDFTSKYWWAREQGLVAAFNLASGSKLTDNGKVLVGRQEVQCYSNERCVCYFMRLPDGNVHGEGFGRGSLQLLHDQRIASLKPLDGSPEYQKWESFRETLKALFKREHPGGNATPWMNASDYNRTRDPRGHSDHYLTGDALQEFVVSGYNRYWWLSYCTDKKPANLSKADVDHKHHLYWDGYVKVLKEIMAGKPFPQPFDAEWRDWGAKGYGTTETHVRGREKTRVGG